MCHVLRMSLQMQDSWCDVLIVQAVAESQILRIRIVESHENFAHTTLIEPVHLSQHLGKKSPLRELLLSVIYPMTVTKTITWAKRNVTISFSVKCGHDQARLTAAVWERSPRSFPEGTLFSRRNCILGDPSSYSGQGDIFG